MKRMLVLLGVLLILCLFFISGCAVNQVFQQISNSKDNKMTLEISRKEFDRLLLPEKIRVVTDRNFSSCQQIQNFCIDNPFLPNCKGSCGKFYSAWNIPSNATLESSVVPILFAEALTKESFTEYDDQTKHDIINSGYFSGCEQIMGYCLSVQSIEGCHKYCSKFLLGFSYSGDLFNNGSEAIFN